MWDPTAERYKTETFFMIYEEVIKSPYPILLYTILEKYKDVYSDYLNLEEISDYNFKNLTRLCVQRSEVNVFEYLAKKEFDYEGTLIELKSRIPNLYSASELLKFGQSLPLLISQRFTKKIYIYSPKYDPRIHLDIQTTAGTMEKISYVVGDLAEVVSKVDQPITAFVLNDITQLMKIAPTDKLKNTTVLLASYGYNFKLDENGELSLKIDSKEMAKKYGFDFAQFVPLDLTEEHFAFG
jgi:hypothetical protein